MSGIKIRIEKLFKNKKNVIISAIDHVLEYGDQIGIEDSRATIKSCSKADGLLLPRFMLKRNWDLFAKEDSPTPIVRINWSSSFYYPLGYKQGYTTIVTNVEEAVEAGAEIVICSLFLEEQNNQEMERDNINLFSKIVKQKEALGIPLIGECYVVEHNDKTIDEVHAKVKRVSRIMAELGADFIKTFYTGDKFNQIVENTPVPIFTIGAEKLNNDLDVLKKAYDSVSKGARGIIFGRNIFMASDPIKIIDALNEVINNKINPKEAIKKYGLK
jgi:fructose-bisphosphate aldolase, class I